MYRSPDGVHYFPTDLVTFLQSPFAAWMDSHYLDHPKDLSPEISEMDWLQEQGIAMESQVVEKLSAELGTVCDLGAIKGLAARVKATQEAIEQEHPVIYQGALRLGNFAGYCDVLLRQEEGRYEPAEIKLAAACRPHFLIQLCAYGEMLEAWQERKVHGLHLFLGNGVRQSFSFGQYRYYYHFIKDRFLEFQRSRGERPEPQVGEAAGRWERYLQDRIQETDSLIQVAGIAAAQVDKLRGAGIETLSALADASDLPVDPEVGARLRQQAKLQRQSRESGNPCHEVLEWLPGSRQGLGLLPPENPGDIFFDFEGYPLADGGLEYLFGVSLFDGKGGLDFVDWWAHSQEQEKQAFESFVDWVWERREKFPDFHVYHYGDYEVAALRRLMGKHGSREDRVDQLLREEVFVNLHGIVRQGLRVGEPSYSIKYLERHYGFGRAGEVQKAVDSIVEYGKWVDSPDGKDWRTSAILREIRDYNIADCESTCALARWLRELQESHSIFYVPPREKEESEREDPTQALAGNLEGRGEVEQKLAHLLAYHRREKKPQWWAYFDRLSKTPWELKEDMECLGDIRLEGEQPEKKSVRATYRFGLDQETKFKPKDQCVFLQDPRAKGSILEIDRRAGRVEVKVGPSVLERLGGVPRRATLVPYDNIPTDKLSGSIQQIAEGLLEGSPVPGAIRDLLDRSCPRIDGLKRGSDLMAANADPVQRACELADGLQNSTLVIQGPPGSGKTYLASHLIRHLVEQGKRVGVTSNSHAVVNHLLARVRDIGPIDFLKMRRESEEELAGPGYHRRDSGKEGFTHTPEGVLLMGGTAWAFCVEQAQGKLDYLFVDEAGQVSLANVVAMSPSASNLILLGDPQQLEQPTQGSHPGESGKSCLSYFLGGRSTIDSTKGLFLKQTRRMHPDLCSFVSDSMYEGRLEAHPLTVNRNLEGLDRRAFPKGAGIQFVGVAHSGNAQHSPEEVAEVRRLIDLLLKGSFKDGESIRPLEPKDILVVAPFNLQVLALQDAVPEGVIVGTVDRFQGREAPVAILSLASSGADLSPRGMEFIFSPNRLNVALSRAQCLAIVVANPDLALAACPTVERLEQVNGFCRILAEAIRPE